jgi:hypothetical protein
LRLDNVDFLEKFLKDWALNKKNIAEKGDLKFLDDLLLSFMTSFASS